MTPKRLRKSATDRVFFGVCGGMGDYLGVDPALLRVAFVLTAFAGGTGVVAYIALVLLMPGGAASPESGPRDTVAENLRGIASEGAESARRLGEALGREAAGVEGAASDRERVRRTVGVLLVIVGALFLLANLGAFRWLDWQTLWPLLLIAAGAALVSQKLRRQR